MTEEQQFDSQRAQEICPWTGFGPTHAPIQLVPESLSPGVKGLTLNLTTHKVGSKLNLTRERLYRVLRRENAAVFFHIGTNGCEVLPLECE
jgi:hypothetical protein